ncbi:MAG: hypothetical protein R2748_11725 [Bryobacterales bacterium]
MSKYARISVRYDWNGSCFVFPSVEPILTHVGLKSLSSYVDLDGHLHVEATAPENTEVAIEFVNQSSDKKLQVELTHAGQGVLKANEPDELMVYEDSVERFTLAVKSVTPQTPDPTSDFETHLLNTDSKCPGHAHRSHASWHVGC